MRPYYTDMQKQIGGHIKLLAAFLSRSNLSKTLYTGQDATITILFSSLRDFNFNLLQMSLLLWII